MIDSSEGDDLVGELGHNKYPLENKRQQYIPHNSDCDGQTDRQTDRFNSSPETASRAHVSQALQELEHVRGGVFPVAAHHSYAHSTAVGRRPKCIINLGPIPGVCVCVVVRVSMRVGTIRKINIPSLLATFLSLETRLLHCLLAWVLVNECWKVVHHCHIHKLLG